MTHLFARAVCPAIIFYTATASAHFPVTTDAVAPVPYLAPATTSASATSVTPFRYLETNRQPSSTLRVREITIPVSVEAAAREVVPVTDTPASVQAYQRCQRVSTRAATDNADMQARIAQCLAELDARREAGR